MKKRRFQPNATVPLHQPWRQLTSFFHKVLSVIVLCVLWASTAHSVDLAADQQAPKIVDVTLSYDNGSQQRSHGAAAAVGKPVDVVFTKNDQSIKIRYVVDDIDDNHGQIVAKIQSANADSDEWSSLSEYSAKFAYGKDFSITGNQSDGKTFTTLLNIKRNTSLQISAK